MKLKKIIIAILATINLLLIFTYCNIKANPIEGQKLNEDSYKTKEEMLTELKEQRRVIEQEKLEAIKAKKLEEENKKKELEGDVNVKKEVKREPAKVQEEDEKKKDAIPKLIVRLRSKHSSKTLCQYDFVIADNGVEKSLNKTNYTDYNSLLEKNSLKVRVDEVINFELIEKPKRMNVYIWGEENESLKVNRGSIRVPDKEGKIVIAIEGIYDNGFIKYAVVLDIRN